MTGTTTDVVIVAYPTYASNGGSVEVLALDTDARTVQGYRPGIYSMTAADAAVGSLPTSGSCGQLLV